jgi:DNA-binding SARP family transcriptional activator
VPQREEEPRRLVIRLFGAVEIEDGDRRLGPGDLGGSRPKQVLEILLAARGHHVPTERMAELLWGADRPADVAASIQTFVSVLRRRLVTDRERARQLVITEAEAYRFATDLVELDLDRFDELLERSAREPTRAARRSIEQALSLARGEVLEDEPYALWAHDLRGSYQGRVLGAHLDAADAALAELDLADALAHSEAAAALDRFSERAHRGAMLALYALGRQHDALARYRKFRALLDEELGLEPTAETRALEAAILRQEDAQSLLPRPISTDGGTHGRASRLLGRKEELQTVIAATRSGLDGNVVLIEIEGESGLGKTRLLDELHLALGDVRVGCASCSALEEHLPYVPLATALRDALADVEVDLERLPALGGIFPELALGGPKSQFDEVEVLEALVALVADHAPLVLLLDDLQWADPHTIAALGYLRRRGACRRAALVTTVRCADLSADHPLSLLSPDLLVQLEPLSPSDLAPLGIPGLYESTGGNPRFVDEALRCGRAGPSKTLTEALLAQCRAEGQWGFRVLTSASVLDQPFDPEPLAELLGTDAAELVEELDRLCERRILRIDGTLFRFRYDLVRQVLLESISPARQRLLRRRLGRVVGAPPRVAIGHVIGAETG